MEILAEYAFDLKWVCIYIKDTDGNLLEENETKAPATVGQAVFSYILKYMHSHTHSNP